MINDQFFNLVEWNVLIYWFETYVVHLHELHNNQHVNKLSAWVTIGYYFLHGRTVWIEMHVH
jgi:hypothetical protein